MRQARFKGNRGVYKCQTFGTLQSKNSWSIVGQHFLSRSEQSPRDLAVSRKASAFKAGINLISVTHKRLKKGLAAHLSV